MGAIAYWAGSDMRLTTSASASVSSWSSTGLACTSVSQASRVSSDSVAPAGLG